MEGSEFQRIAGIQRLLLLLQHAAHMNGFHRMGEAQPGAAIAAGGFIQAQDVGPLGILAGLCNIAGNQIGVNFFDKKGGAVVKPVMLLVLTIFLVKTIMEIAGV